MVLHPQASNLTTRTSKTALMRPIDSPRRTRLRPLPFLEFRTKSSLVPLYLVIAGYSIVSVSLTPPLRRLRPETSKSGSLINWFEIKRTDIRIVYPRITEVMKIVIMDGIGNT